MGPLNRPYAMTGEDVFALPEFHALMKKIGVNSDLPTEFISLTIEGPDKPVRVVHHFQAVGQMLPPPKMEFPKDILKPQDHQV
jgi:hypothetical protein